MSGRNRRGRPGVRRSSFAWRGRWQRIHDRVL